MDVFFYWKDFTEDLKAGRVGSFRSNRDKLAELKDGAPDNIWLFKTPKGHKGRVQLLARLRWTDTPVKPVLREPDQSYIFYDPEHASSVRFCDSATESAIDAASAWVRLHFPTAVRSNFQGENGQQALRGPMIKELERLATTLSTEPFYTPPPKP